MRYKSNWNTSKICGSVWYVLSMRNGLRFTYFPYFQCCDTQQLVCCQQHYFSVDLNSTVASGLCKLNYITQLPSSDGKSGITRSAAVSCFMLHIQSLVFLVLSVAAAVTTPGHRLSNSQYILLNFSDKIHTYAIFLQLSQLKLLAFYSSCISADQNVAEALSQVNSSLQLYITFLITLFSEIFSSLWSVLSVLELFHG